MSKIPSDYLRETIHKMVVASQEKPRKFRETVELQIGLKNYDTQKDKRFSGSLRLPTNPRPNATICLIGDQHHRDAAASLDIATRSTDELKSFKKNKKLVKRFAKSFDAFIASESLIKMIPRILGPGLNKAGKFPTILGEHDDIQEKINEIQSTIKFQLKKVLCLNTAIGHLDMTEEEIFTNLTLSVNFLVSLLKKKWQNVKSLNVKTTMGRPYRIF